MLSAAGRILVLLGSVVLLFVAYQLWGTGLLQARSQSGLASDFAQRLEAVGVTDDLLSPWETEGGRPDESSSTDSSASSATAEGGSVPNYAAEPGGDADSEAGSAGATGSADAAGAGLSADAGAAGAGAAGAGAAETPAASRGASAGLSNLPDTSDAPIPVTSLSQRATFRSTVEYLSPVVEDRLEMLYPPDGQALARLVIPAIGVDEMVVAGVEAGDLRRGPGHYGFTPLPGQPGNAGIAGHRTTYGAPFERIDELKVDDLIHVQTLQGSFTYQVIPPVASEVLEFEVGHQIVLPHEVGVLDDYYDNRLTLTSCHPRYSSSRRIIVQAVLLGDPVVRLPRPGAEPEPEPPRVLADEPTPGGDSAADLSGGERIEAGSAGAGSGAPDAGAGAGSATEPVSASGLAASAREGSSSAAPGGTSAVPGGGSSGQPTPARAAAPRISSGFGTGLDGDPRAVAPAVIWGLAAAAVWITGSIWSRHWRRLATWSITIVLFLLVLFAAFTHVDRALPSF